MTILEFFKTVHPSVLAAKMIFKYLQEHYPVLKISEIANTSSGGTPNRGMVEYYNGNIPWVKSGELKDGLITSCDEYITEKGLKNSSAKLFPKGTLLVAMYGANIGKTGILNFDATTNQAICAVFPKTNISNEYLYWYFKQQRIDFIAVGKGGAQPNISQTVIKNASIVVPDDDIQDKIVRFLERIEKGNGIDYDFFIPDVLKDVETIYKYKNSYVTLSDSFETQLTQLENLNQAILQEAVQGKLVAQNPDDEPASELLKRIKAEKALSGKKQKPLPPIKPEDLPAGKAGIPFEIPESWVWCRLGEICEINPRNKVDDEVEAGFIPMSMISQIMGIKPTYEVRRWGAIKSGFTHFANNDVVVAKITPCFENSKAGIISDLPNGIGAGTTELNVLRGNQFVLPEYIYVFVKRIDFLKNGKRIMKGVAGQQRVPTEYFHHTLIPLPPLSEQKRIVTEIEKQLTKTKQLSEHVIANQKATEQLLKALLYQAFEVEEKEENKTYYC